MWTVGEIGSTNQKTKRQTQTNSKKNTHTHLLYCSNSGAEADENRAIVRSNYLGKTQILTQRDFRTRVVKRALMMRKEETKLSFLYYVLVIL